MKKIVIAALLVLGTVGVFAQAGTWYFSILPGYTFSSTADDYNYYPYYSVKINTKNDFVGSLDGGYYFTDNVGLHFAYVYSPGHHNARINLLGMTTQSFEIDRTINIVQIGPEFAFGSKENQGYFQVNLGWTFGSPSTHIDFYGTRYYMGDIGNEFTYGLALGYRHFWGNTALSVQTAYNHINDWDVNNYWDIRLGVTWRF